MDKHYDILVAGAGSAGFTAAVMAGRLGNKAMFIIHTNLNVELEQNDGILRIKDNRMYRITGNAIDMTTPEVASDQYREVNAEVLS